MFSLYLGLLGVQWLYKDNVHILTKKYFIVKNC